MSLTTAQKKETESFLNGYTMNKKMLRMEKYEQQFMSSGKLAEYGDGMPLQTPLARANMYEVRHFILALPNSDEKLFLYYHYVKGSPVRTCAELLGISERSAFRLKNRALELAYGNLHSPESTSAK